MTSIKLFCRRSLKYKVLDNEQKEMKFYNKKIALAYMELIQGYLIKL